jgi:drug/metabolite transporter (DMT)-like permease
MGSMMALGQTRGSDMENSNPAAVAGQNDRRSSGLNAQYRGIILILIGYALLAGESAAVHQAGRDATPLQFALLRSAGSLVLVVVLARNIGLSVFRTHHLGLQFVRGGLTVVSIWGIFYGFAVLPLADATAVSYTRAVFLSILAVLILRERVDAARWAATTLGLLGCLIIVRPAFSSWRPDYLIILIGAGLNAGAMIATKVLERRDTPLTVMAYMSLISFAASLPALASPWPDAAAWPWLLGVAILGPAALYVGLLAIRAADVSIIAPFDYSRLIMAAGLGYVFFGEQPSLADFVGAAIITLACIWTVAAARLQKHAPAGQVQ